MFLWNIYSFYTALIEYFLYYNCQIDVYKNSFLFLRKQKNWYINTKWNKKEDVTTTLTKKKFF